MPRHDGIITAHKAEAAIAPYRLVVIGAADGGAKQAADDDAAIIGVSSRVAAAKGGTVEVHRSGIVEVEYGGAVTRGKVLTANADGKAIATTTDGAHCIGIAEVSGVAGDIGSVLIAPSRY